VSTGVPCPHCGDKQSTVRGLSQRGTHKITHKAAGRLRFRCCAVCGTRFTTVEVLDVYLEKLEDAQPAAVIEQLQKARSAIGTSIDILTNIKKIKGGLPL
jgi:transcriptional regulator NrdR family protein